MRAKPILCCDTSRIEGECLASKNNLSTRSPVATVAVRSNVRSNAFVCVCLLTPCGHLLGKG